MKNRAGRRAGACAVAVALYVGSTDGALGGEAEPIVGMPAGPGPEYQALGIPAGGFLAFPSLTVTTTFDDNIKRTDANTLSDTFFSFRPSIELQSRWAQHELNLSAFSDTLVYAKYSTENITTYGFNAAGRLDVRNNLRIFGEASAAQLFAMRSSPELPDDALKPLPYKLAHGDVSVEYQPAQLGFEIGFAFDRYRYGSIDIVGGGEVNWDDQNRDIAIPRARVFYEFSPGYAAYVEGTYEERDFELAVDRFGFDRSSHGYRVRGGVEAPVGNLLQGEAFLGYLDQQYAAPLADISGFDFGALLDWFVTPLTTLHLRASRIINDTTFPGVSGADDRSIAFSIDHGLLSNVILRANVGYTHSAYRGDPRIDEVMDAGIGADYYLNRYLSLGARYAYQQRASNVDGQGYSVNLFSITIRGQL